jgi:hypothetical protein
MKDIDSHLEQLLNLEPVKGEVTTELVPLAAIKQEVKENRKILSDGQIHEDFNFIRTKMTQTVLRATEALEDLASIAASSQDAEHFAAFASLLKSLNETNRNILDLHKAAVEVQNSLPVEEEQNKIVNNNLIIGNSEAVMELIKSQLGVSRGLEAAGHAIIIEDNDPGLQRTKPRPAT